METTSLGERDLRTNLENRDIDWPAGRRSFLKSAGLFAGSVVVGGIAATSTASAAVTDADILNFALNLEYLEAEFYLRATRGTGLPPDDTSGSGVLGTVTGGNQVPFTTAAVREYAEEIARDERHHVLFLRAALAGARVARPKINLRASFTAAARAAGLIDENQTFDPFANETNFLLGAFIFEDVGVTAYKGAARLLVNKDYLEAAAGILAVEAYHAGAVRAILYGKGLYAQARKISDLRDSVDGTTDVDQGIGTSTGANLTPTDENGIAFSRTAPQVLNIVYLGGTSKGGFFPDGLNGAIA